MRGYRFSQFAIASLLACGFVLPSYGQERCGAGVDLMVQALERVRPDSNQSAIRDSVELLKHATSVCPNLGDAWYYRSVLEGKLGNTRLADYSREKASQVGSDAMQQQVDPFKLAAPPTAAPLGRAIPKRWCARGCHATRPIRSRSWSAFPIAASSSKCGSIACRTAVS